VPLPFPVYTSNLLKPMTRLAPSFTTPLSNFLICWERSLYRGGNGRRGHPPLESSMHHNLPPSFPCLTPSEIRIGNHGFIKLKGWKGRREAFLEDKIRRYVGSCKQSIKSLLHPHPHPPSYGTNKAKRKYRKLSTFPLNLNFLLQLICLHLPGTFRASTPPPHAPTQTFLLPLPLLI